MKKKTKSTMKQKGDWILKYMNRKITFDDIVEERKAVKEAYEKHIKPILPTPIFKK